MKDKRQVVEAYKRYVSSIKNNNNLIEHFKAMMEYFDKHLEDKDLALNLQLDCIYRTVNEVERANIRLKNYTNTWNKEAVDEFIKRLRILSKCHQEGDSDAYKVNFCKLTNIIKSFDNNTPLQLYLYLLHSKSSDGRELYGRLGGKIKELLQADDDEGFNHCIQELS